MCGGAGWYFKIYRPKQEKAAGPEEDYGDELEDYDGGDDMPPWDEDDHEEMEDEEWILQTAPLNEWWKSARPSALYCNASLAGGADDFLDWLNC